MEFRKRLLGTISLTYGQLTCWICHPLLAHVVLAGILLLALAVRVLQSRFGLPYLHHWDEPFTASTALRILKTGDYNPHFFKYGSLMIYANLIVDILHYLYLRAQPPEAGHSIASLKDIIINTDTGFHWTISHPTFYLWNRWLTAIMGAASVFLVFKLAKELAGNWAGVLAACSLAIIPIHIAHSSYITPDVPSSFFALLSVSLSVLFLTYKRPVYCVFALVSSGLATSIKYNMVVSLAAPLFALAWAALTRSDGHRWWLWLGTVFIPPIAFVIGTPFAVIDLVKFVGEIGYNVYHYSVEGHGAFSSEPGLPHMTFQLNIMLRNWGEIVSALIAIGLVSALVRRKVAAVTILIFPFLYFYAVISSRPNFHRNLIVLYPIAAVFFGCGVVALYKAVARLFPKGTTIRSLIIAALVIGVAFFLARGATSAAVRAWQVWTMPESRTETIDRLNDIVGSGEASVTQVGIAEELRIHEDDLRRLSIPYGVFPTSGLICYSANLDIVVTGRRHVSRGEATERAQALEQLVTEFGKQHPPIYTVGRENSPLWLDLFSVNPETLIFGLPRDHDYRPDLCEDGRYNSLHHVLMRKVDLLTAGPLTMPVPVPLRAGAYKFSWQARGTKAAGQYPLLEVSIFANLEDPEKPVELRAETFELTKYAEEYELSFELTQPTKVIVQFTVTNDLFIPEREEDRNVFFQEIGLKSVREPD